MDEASKNESSPRPFYFFNEDKMEASQVLEANLFNVGFFFLFYAAAADAAAQNAFSNSSPRPDQGLILCRSDSQSSNLSLSPSSIF